VRDFCSGPARRELQNAAHVRLFAADAVELDAQGAGGVVVPLFEVAAKKDLPADAHGRPEVLADLGRRLAALHGRRRLLGREGAGHEEEGE
jgi:hypothetical protein